MTRGQNGDEIWSARFSPNGKQLVIGCHRGALKVIDTESPTETRVIDGHLGWVGSIAFSPSVDLVATGSYEGVVKLWDVNRWEVIYTLSDYARNVKTPFTCLCLNQQHPNDRGEIKSVCFSPDGKLLAGGLSYEDEAKAGIKIGIWDPVRGAFLGELKTEWDPTKLWLTLNALSFTTDNLGISCSAHVVTKLGYMEKTFTTSPLTLVFDLKTQKQVKAFAGDGREDLVALFSSDGEKLACGAKGGVITVWDARTGSEARRLSGHTDSVDVLTFCSGERLLVSGGWDKTVRVWNVDLGEQIAWMPYSDRIIAIWSDPKGRQILVADGGGPSNVPNIDCIELVGVPVHDRREAPRDPSESRASRWWRRIRVR